MDGRKEKRNPQSLTVLIASGAQPVVAEYASTENISSYGVRLRTDRPWKPDTPVLLKSLQGDFWARARVVYCRTLQAKAFAVGLEFLARTRDWATQVRPSADPASPTANL
jgi:hypothetical protein